MKLWQKNTQLDVSVERYTVGDDPELDKRLLPYDCLASKAHAETLCRAGILTRDETDRLNLELDNIRFSPDFVIAPGDEDCHTAIENVLTEKLGDLGKKIHTGRSRNDQVLAALRLYYKDALKGIVDNTKKTAAVLDNLVATRGDVRFPGYTHTRKAMVSTIAMWAGGFAESMRDNLRLIETARLWIDQSPLGTGAGYGVPLDLDRKFTAEQAGFSRVQESPVYVQLSRGKFEWLINHALLQILLDLNRLASDLIFYSLPTLGYMKLPSKFCTGSSIMPQKKNPDVLELMRARFHRVLGNETQLGSLMSNLISGYHRDLQLTKKPVFESLDITMESLSIIIPIITDLEIDETACSNDLTEEIYATEKVYDLVKQGLTFRDAYRQIGKNYDE